jgi:hypothetical protein
MQRKLILLRLERQFPNWAEAIEREYRDSKDFRALCNDFQVCAVAKEKWEESEAPIAPERRREYAEWLEELLVEIKDWLQQSATASKSM